MATCVKAYLDSSRSGSRNRSRSGSGSRSSVGLIQGKHRREREKERQSKGRRLRYVLVDEVHPALDAAEDAGGEAQQDGVAFPLAALVNNPLQCADEGDEERSCAQQTNADHPIIIKA